MLFLVRMDVNIPRDLPVEQANEIKVEYLPTGDMIADIFPKPLHGALLSMFTGLLMG